MMFINKTPISFELVSFVCLPLPFLKWEFHECFLVASQLHHRRDVERWSSILYHITHLLMDISCWKIQHALLEALVLLLQFNLHASKKVGRSPKLRIREVVVALPTSQENSKSIWRKKSKRVQIFSWPFTKGWDFAEMEKKLQLSLNIGVFVVKLFFSKSYKSGRGGRKCHIIFWQVTRHHLKGLS